MKNVLQQSFLLLWSQRHEKLNFWIIIISCSSSSSLRGSRRWWSLVQCIKTYYRSVLLYSILLCINATCNTVWHGRVQQRYKHV